MSLLSVIRGAVKTTDKVTKSLQAEVTHKAWIGVKDMYGTPKYASGVKRRAIVDQSSRDIMSAEGETVHVKAYIAFIGVVPPNGAANRVEPIDDRDIIILPDGTTGPVIRTSGFIDAGTKKPVLTEVWIGA